MTLTPDIDEMRRNLPPADLGYVRKRFPQALKRAERYNAVRRAVDPADLASYERALAAKARLMEVAQ